MFATLSLQHILCSGCIDVAKKLNLVKLRNNMITKAEYEKKCLEFEEAMMYEGRGEYNGYICEKCGYTVATLYKDKGVTPFVIKCPQCG